MMKGHILALLQNNSAPSDVEISEINELLAEPLKDRVRIQSEIGRLEALLEENRKLLYGVEDLISTYNTMLAPIRRLPVDIIREIFYWCLPTHRYSLMDPSEAPILLTRICSSWRPIALSSPRIWTRLHISLPGPELEQRRYRYGTLRSPNSAHLHGASLRDRILQVRAKGAHEWLSRSGDCLLSISLLVSDSMSYLPSDLDHDPIEEIFQTIVPFAKRWKDVELTMPYKLYKLLEKRLSTNMLSSIRSFKAQLRDPLCRRSDGDGRAQGYEPDLLLGAPNLSKLSFRKDLWHPKSWEREIPTTTWNRLTCLSLHSPVPDVELYRLLSQCHNLTYCKLVIEHSWYSLAENNDVPNHLPTATINLPHLRSFSIMDGGYTYVMTKLFQILNTPSLTNFAYRSSGPRARAHSPPPNFNAEFNPEPPAPLIPLISQNSISQLSLHTCNLSASDIEICIQVGHSVKHLIIDPESETWGARPTPIWPYDDRWDANILSCGRSSDNRVSNVPLLPELEVLEVFELSTFSDTDLLNLITSRIDAWSCGKIPAPLKLVKIHFQRDRQLDVTDEAIQYAKTAGIDLRLELKYTTGKLKHLDPSSSSFGLTFDDLTWNEDDIEESSPLSG